MGDLLSPRQLTETLRRYRIRPSKRLGQYFLVDQDVSKALIAEVVRHAPDTIVEIGAGLGTVTTQLARIARRVVAFEVDERLIPILQAALRGVGNVEIRCQDILEFDISSAFGSGSVFAVGNLPYGITAPILKHLVTHRNAVSHAVVMTQREVAEKIVASPGPDGTALGVFLQAYAEIAVLRQVSKRAFVPVPGVDSTLWRISFLNRQRFCADQDVFFAVVRLLYGKRRKMIRGVLRELLPPERIPAVLAAAAIDGTVRGETLAFEGLDRLAQAVVRAKG